MKRLFIPLFVISVLFTISSCESCYTCTFDASEQINIVDSMAYADTSTYEEERCGPNYEIKEFIADQETIGWECTKQ